MFFNGKKIIYLNCYEDGIKGGSAGFVRLIKEKNSYRMDVTLQKLHQWSDGNYEMMLEGEEAVVPLGKIAVKNEAATDSRTLSVRDEFLCFQEKEESGEGLYGVVIQSDKKRRVCGYWRMPQKAFLATEEEIHKEALERKETVFAGALAEDKRETLVYAYQEKAERYSDNKWEQLCKIYPKAHPFGDEREFITIDPKDFIVLQSSYQKLVNNSFLLHGYYNYRHLILGPCDELCGEKKYALGVPGNFYEREKMVAVMFGFEGFECSGTVEQGKFGYYMRGVEL